MTSQPGVALQRWGTITVANDLIWLEQNGYMYGSWSPDEAVVTVQNTQEPVRYTPFWAILAAILCFLSLIGFLLGFVFLFVRQTRYKELNTVSVTVGGVPVVTLERAQLPFAKTALPQQGPTTSVDTSATAQAITQEPHSWRTD